MTSPQHFILPDVHRPPGGIGLLVDVTLRDGGFTVGFQWPTTFPVALTKSLSALGVPIVELGYIGGLPDLHGVGAVGTSAHLTPDFVAGCRVGATRLAAMIHPSALSSDINFVDFVNAGLDLVRFVYQADWRSQICDLAGAALDTGLRVSVNLALASRYAMGRLLEEAVAVAAEIEPDVIYIADTCGAMLPDEVRALVAAIRIELPHMSLGFHAHDFLSLGLANSLAARSAGAEYVDAAVAGLGRSAGNLRTELWLATHQRPPINGRQFQSLLELMGGLEPRRADTVFAMLCGALNLTPPEEDLLIQIADELSVTPRTVALALASRSELRGAELTASFVRAASEGW